MSAAGCEICERLAKTPPDGWVYADEYFTAGVAPGAEIPGWLMLSLRRHAPPLASELDVPEAERLGLVLKRLSLAIEEVTGAERVYHMQWGEYLPHWTLMLAPRGADVPESERRVELLFARSKYVDPAAAEATAARIREQLAGASTEPA